MENLYKLLADLHRPCERQGPGSVETSRLAMRLAGLEQAKGLKIADVGCGTGASALLLAEALSAEVTAPFWKNCSNGRRHGDLRTGFTLCSVP